MTYEDLKKANRSIKVTDIKGKNYAEVNQRIKAFRMVYPEGFIIPEMISNENGVCVFRATVGYYSEDLTKVILACGTAYEREDSSFINKTSYIENCETSAVGRALGMCGFGIDTSVRSAEEQLNAELQQTAEKKIDKTKVDALCLSIAKNEIDSKVRDEVLAKYGYNAVAEIKVKDYMNIVDEFKALKEA